MAKAVLALLLATALSLYSHHSHAVGKKWDFDHWSLSLRWAPTVCLQTNKCCSSNACCRASAPVKFVIHELRPRGLRSDNIYCNCTGFDLRKIASLIPNLAENWPFLNCEYSTLCNGDDTRLNWAHQWEKYGTCGYPDIKDEYNYFLKALMLYNEYNLTKVFSNAGFQPSNYWEYGTSEIIDAIKKAVGVSPSIDCDNNYVRSVQLCFTKDFKLRDCYASSCPEAVKLPKYGPLGGFGIAEVTS